MLDLDGDGKRVNAKEGDVLQDGWKVFEVRDDLVTLEKQTGPKEKVRAQMPVGIKSVGYSQPIPKATPQGASTPKAVDQPKGTNAGTPQGGRVK